MLPMGFLNGHAGTNHSLVGWGVWGGFPMIFLLGEQDEQEGRQQLASFPPRNSPRQDCRPPEWSDSSGTFSKPKPGRLSAH